jgi:hypothetical protein
MGTLRDAVEATLVGRDHRLVERCDVDGILDGILTALDLYGIYDVEVLVENLQTSFGALQTQLGESAPPSFLALLKAQLGRSQPHTHRLRTTRSRIHRRQLRRLVRVAKPSRCSRSS